MELIFVTGIGIALLIEFLLVAKREKSEPDLVLTVWMFIVLIHLFLFYIYFNEEIYHFPLLLGIDIPLPLLHGVFLYLYAGSLTEQLPRRRILLLLHFVPALAMYLYLFNFFTLPAEQKVQIFQTKGAGYELFNDVKQLCIAVSGVAYVAWTSVLLRDTGRISAINSPILIRSISNGSGF